MAADSAIATVFSTYLASVAVVATAFALAAVNVAAL